MSSVILDQLNLKITEISAPNEDSIIVLKGIPLSLLGVEKPDLPKMMEGKLQYFSAIIDKKQKYISYEEFLLLYSFFIEQFTSIYIIENNQFINLYPFYQGIDEDLFRRLIVFFDPDDLSENEDVVIGDLSKYTELFTKCDEIDGLKLIAYQEEPLSDKEYKIKRITLFEEKGETVEHVVLSEDELGNMRHVIEINNEADYIKLIRMILSDVDDITVIDQLSEIDAKLLINRLSILKNYFFEDVNLTFARIEKTIASANIYPECKAILKKFWGADSFRTIKIYDINKLEQQSKQVICVSQEQIISDLITEVEKSVRGDYYRDLFVTAPTGSGKSVMFQIPAIYLAEKFGLMTIVISPLIGLMNDQITGLVGRHYNYARTIHSDISPVVKQDIMNDIRENRCHLLYISPETLLSRSDISQLIGSRQLGLLVIDEAHIVTTWGKQFRPDYWFLGDYVSKLRQTTNFVIATFTATAIYGGVENMFVETKQSLRMVSPITWLGYMRRDDIVVNIDEVRKITNKTEYELNKFDSLIEHIKRSLVLGKKTLIYFPTVALIQRFYDYASSQSVGSYITRYHGQLHKTEKIENYEAFLNGEKTIMLATKAFGMGIDIEDIQVIIHFAPTGNVCDYVQEIGRAARRMDLVGEAIYNYMSNDFKHINRLHGLSSIQRTQLVRVIEKIYELYMNKVSKQSRSQLTRKRNSMLIDAESFSYIFEGRMNDQDDAISKVKSAMLMIQKDFEGRFGFSPFYIRPIPLFSQGFFQLSENERLRMQKKYPNMIEIVDKSNDICMIDLGGVWEKSYKNEFSFPQFKYLLYTKDENLDLTHQFIFSAALCVDVCMDSHYSDKYNLLFDSFKKMIIHCVRELKYYSIQDLSQDYKNISGKSFYFSKNVCEVMIAAINVYRQSFCKRTSNYLMQSRELNSGEINYKFEPGIDDFFRWVENGYKKVQGIHEEGKIYVINTSKTDLCRELTTQLGVLETLDVLTFNSLGGANSQLYIYVNQTQMMKRIIDRPEKYENKLLTLINDRHNLSVEMLTFLFSNKFSSKEIWDYLEDYFLGIIPEEVKSKCQREHQISFENL